MISQEELKELFHYDPESGIFTRRVDRGNRKAGEVAGCIGSSGYYRISIDNKSYLAHRLAWLYVYGRFPDGLLDHWNTNKLDNRIKNLRDCTHSTNHQNQHCKSNNILKCKGVSYYPDRPKTPYLARIKVNGAQKNLGRFATQEAAKAAYDKAALEGFGEFARL